MGKKDKEKDASQTRTASQAEMSSQTEDKGSEQAREQSVDQRNVSKQGEDFTAIQTQA